MGVLTTTTIVHSVRAELRISCDQYVIADTIAYLSGLRKDTSVTALSFCLGIMEEDIQDAILDLLDLGIINIKGDLGYVVTPKWRCAFGDDKLFDNPLPKGAIAPPDYAPGFWQIYKRQGSSKPKTLAYWNQVIKTIPAEKIIAAAKNYMESVSDHTYLMYSEKFMNPKTKYYESWLPLEGYAPPVGEPVKNMEQFV